MKAVRGQKQKWAIERRLAFIEFRLQWDGKVNRTDVATKFGISLNQATNDLVAYAKAAPENIRYDLSLRAYVRGENFSARYITSSAQSYLSQLLASEETESAPDCWIGHVPSFDVLSSPTGEVANEILQPIVGAILAAEPIDGLLQNNREPNPSWTTIFPHALLMDGERWCVRAYSLSADDFETIPLARIAEVRVAGTSVDRPANDVEWTAVVELEIAPNPNLREADRNTIIRDLGMKGGVAAIKVRRALLPQLKSRLGISSPPSPNDRLVVLSSVETGNMEASP